jgi:SPP1 gp7 family putative phage head morphogenesis protein
MPDTSADTQGKPAPQPMSESAQNPIDSLYAGMVENTFFKSPLVSDSYRPPYNPDDLWQKKGDYSIYEKMVEDDQVSVCLQLKKDLVLGSGGSFEPGDEDQDEMIEELKASFFEDYEGDFMEDLEEILSCYEFGFSITEKLFKLRDGMRLGIKGLRTRHPNSWRLYQDDKGAVTKFEQVTVQGDKDINPKSIIHAVNAKRFQNPYGRSDLRAAYNAWFTKTQVVRFFGIFLEKAASPIPVGRYDKNAPKESIDKLFEIFKKFQTKTAIVIPKEIEAEFLEAKNSGDAYIKAIHLFNMFIGRALFIPDLLGFTGGETSGGSLALGEKQMNLFFLHVLKRRTFLENIVNKELVWPQIAYNYGFVKNYPKFRLKPLDDNAAVDLAKVWLEAVKGKAYKPTEEEINHFRKLVKFPEGAVEFYEPAPNPFDPNNPNPGPMPNMPGKKISDKMNQDGNEEDDSANDDEAQASKKSPADEVKKFGKVYDIPKGDYSRKVNFKNLETKLNDYDQSVMAEASKITKKMFADLLDQIEKKKIVQGQNVDRIDSLSLKYKKELKQVLKSSFMQLFKDAQSQASQELLKADYRKPLTNQEFLDVIEAETFNFIGDYEYNILKSVRTELIAAIKDGKSVSAVLDDLDENLGGLSDTQIERFARTKHTEVMNNARVEFFDSTGVVAAYQYSAVLDDATSEICRGLHGKIFVAGDEPIPPMHFNCRSILVPITKYEDFKPTESIQGQSVDDFIEENKGTGFSTK